jgi:hypothetical protein
MRELFGNLVGFWLDQTGSIPGVSYSVLSVEYTGPFVRFAVALCAELAISVRANPDRGGVETAFLAALQDVTENPIRVRTWLDAVIG